MQNSKEGEKNSLRKSMKEAFEIVKPSKNVIKVGPKRKKKSIRDWLWEYPSNVDNLFKNTAPLSFILIFSIVGIALFLFLTSSTFANVLSKDRNEVFVEGSVGAISTFNPIFTSQSSVDADIRALVFEKLINISKDGTPVAGIAKEWKSSADGKSYEITISPDHKWQDGKPLTIEDVLFTFDISKELTSKHNYDTIGSPLQDVKIEKVAEDKIRFTLSESNATFFEAISVYIIPKHRFEGIRTTDIPFNSFAKYPLGSGPYEVYRSEPNVVYLKSSDYYSPKPNIETFIYRVYSTNTALESAFRNGILDAMGTVDQFSVSYVDEYSGYKEYSVTLDSRLRMIFFNTRKEKLETKEFRIALNHLIDKNRLIEKANISGDVSYSPISSSSWAYSESNTIKYEYNQARATEILNNLGYVKNSSSGYFETEDKKILSLTLSYYDNELNERIASVLKGLLKEEGVVLNLEPLTYTQLTQEIVATRDFELLMYEIETTIDPDQYNLWHSLKSNYPDLNLSGYSYERVDILLEEARKSVKKDKRVSNYALFQKYITQDVPVILLYHPKYIYVIREDVNIQDIGNIVFPYQRFDKVYQWDR
ncbi:MAG TPA: ABC transporter substrate-binding protein [Candidatus Dojkabacteria bacterium]|nr:ABC transporter substrate-binding protein [Candidatus Dojkabacteria bacterium]